MKNGCLFLALSFLITLTASAGQAFLGKTHLTNLPDRDVIWTKSCKTAKGTFRKIYFTVSKNTAKINRFKVHFGNGSVQTIVPKKKVYGKNSSSRRFDLIGYERCISKIVVTGDTRSKKGKLIGRRQAKVSFYGVD